jgi:hypothetical protein
VNRTRIPSEFLIFIFGNELKILFNKKDYPALHRIVFFCTRWLCWNNAQWALLPVRRAAQAKAFALALRRLFPQTALSSAVKMKYH